MSTASNTIDTEEIEHFSADADQWWDLDGPHAPLHHLNPERIRYIKQQILAHYDCGSLKGKSVLDIGCGGGLVCEPLTRLGAEVSGADADPVAINVASAHAAAQGLDINYRNEPAENITETYDVVLALEIIEHVSDVDAFVKECARLVKPGGLIIFSTLNRTARSFAAGIVAAEYILRWVPRGTHDWKKFLKPSEIAKLARQSDLEPFDVTGLHYDPLKSEFSLSEDKIDVNYFLSASKYKVE